MELTRSAKETFTLALKTLKGAQIPFLVGGAFAVHHYAGYLRDTRDLDIFLHKGDVDKAMASLKVAGFTTKVEYKHSLAKAFRNAEYIDLIFGSGNWLIQVDDSFFARSVDAKVLGVPVQLLSPEEIIWSKSYVAARERFDGSDIAHLISATEGKLDWKHLLDRFGDHWQLLLADVLLHDFAYPSERNYVPHALKEELAQRMRQVVNEPSPKEKVCRGTLLDRYSFLYDVETEGYEDPREQLAKEHGYTAEDVIEDRTHARASTLKLAA